MVQSFDEYELVRDGDNTTIDVGDLDSNNKKVENAQIRWSGEITSVNRAQHTLTSYTTTPTTLSATYGKLNNPEEFSMYQNRFSYSIREIEQPGTVTITYEMHHFIDGEYYNGTPSPNTVEIDADKVSKTGDTFYYLTLPVPIDPPTDYQVNDLVLEINIIDITHNSQTIDEDDEFIGEIRFRGLARTRYTEVYKTEFPSIEIPETNTTETYFSSLEQDEKSTWRNIELQSGINTLNHSINGSGRATIQWQYDVVDDAFPVGYKVIHRDGVTYRLPLFELGDDYIQYSSYRVSKNNSIQVADLVDVDHPDAGPVRINTPVHGVLAWREDIY